MAHVLQRLALGGIRREQPSGLRNGLSMVPGKHRVMQTTSTAKPVGHRATGVSLRAAGGTDNTATGSTRDPRQQTAEQTRCGDSAGNGFDLPLHHSEYSFILLGLKPGEAPNMWGDVGVFIE